MRFSGVSEIVGTIILLAIVLIAGVTIYAYVMNQGNIVSGGANVQLSVVSLSAVPGGAGLLSLSVVNAGSVPLSSVAVSLSTGGSTVFSTGTASGSSWASVFGGSAWHSQGATPYTATVSVSPGIYQVTADWVNTGGPGMSAITYSGAEAASQGWQTSASATFYSSYSQVAANPLNPQGFGTVMATGALPTAEFDYGTPNSYQGNTYLGLLCQPFPTPFTALNNFDGYPTEYGYTAFTYMVFTSSVTFNIETDDEMAVFYQAAVVSSGQALPLSLVIPSGVLSGTTYNVVVAVSSVQGSAVVSQQVVAQ
jgi:flagellin-like protein